MLIGIGIGIFTGGTVSKEYVCCSKGIRQGHSRGWREEEEDSQGLTYSPGSQTKSEPNCKTGCRGLKGMFSQQTLRHRGINSIASVLR